MRSKPTAGERIELNGVREALCRPYLTIDGFRTGAVYAIPRKRAKAIDRAIRKAAKDAATAERARIVRALSDYSGMLRRRPDFGIDTVDYAIEIVTAMDELSHMAKARTKPATVRGRKGKK